MAAGVAHKRSWLLEVHLLDVLGRKRHVAGRTLALSSRNTSIDAPVAQVSLGGKR